MFCMILVPLLVPFSHPPTTAFLRRFGTFRLSIGFRNLKPIPGVDHRVANGSQWRKAASRSLLSGKQSSVQVLGRWEATSRIARGCIACWASVDPMPAAEEL